jgi:23S rRNA (guanosine2251-2'-O)-methyltransferase
MPGPSSIEGVRPILEAIRAGRRRVHSVEVSEGDGSPGLRELRALAEQQGIPMTAARGGPSRAQALADPYPEVDFERLLEAEGPRFLVALDRVTDVGNFGSIARTAEAAGAIGMILEHHHAPPIGPGALRASAGALEHLRVGRTPNLARALALAPKRGSRGRGSRDGGFSHH